MGYRLGVLSTPVVRGLYPVPRAPNPDRRDELRQAMPQFLFPAAV